MFEEWRRVGVMLGIPSSDLPATERDYWRVFEDMISNRLERTEALGEILTKSFYTSYPVPPHAPWIPAPVWKAFTVVWSRFMYRLTVATLPETFRQKLSIRYTVIDAFLFRAFARAVRIVYPLTPERTRYIPLAWRAITDARAHPEAYLCDSGVRLRASA
jgi:uncharacterized protein (DUF2236 family)